MPTEIEEYALEATRYELLKQEPPVDLDKFGGVNLAQVDPTDPELPDGVRLAAIAYQDVAIPAIYALDGGVITLENLRYEAEYNKGAGQALAMGREAAELGKGLNPTENMPNLTDPEMRVLQAQNRGDASRSV